MKLIAIIILPALSISCTWVNENPQGQSVAITDSTINCPKVGVINVSTKHKVGFIKRGGKKVLSELQTLARNEAIKINANTIQVKGEPIGGKQSYTAYRCPR